MLKGFLLLPPPPNAKERKREQDTLTSEIFFKTNMRRSHISGHNNNRHLTGEELENNIGGLPVTEPKLRELFDSLDKNHNGYLDFNEVKDFYKSFDNYGVFPSDKQIESDIRKYAKSPDNNVSFDEFCCLILSLAQR